MQQPLIFRGGRKSIRRRSNETLFGLPIYDIAIGPDAQNGELRGHARGIIAVGDVATGILAVGGFARGLVALGGLSIGVVSIGGASLGILSFGGLAVGLFALGALALGAIAIGAAVMGYYALGAAAIGQNVVSILRHDPQAVTFFNYWLPFILIK